MVNPLFLNIHRSESPFNFLRSWPAIISFIIMTAAGIAEADTTLDQTQIERLMAGEVLVSVVQTEDSPKGMVAATILINAPREHVWHVMTDCGEIPTFVPGVESCQIMSSGPNWEIIKHEVK